MWKQRVCRLLFRGRQVTKVTKVTTFPNTPHRLIEIFLDIKIKKYIPKNILYKKKLLVTLVTLVTSAVKPSINKGIEGNLT